MVAKTFGLAMLAALAMTAPLAAAQDDVKTNESDTRPDDAAWTEDCPPDMMCAFGGTEDNPCIECSGPVDDGASEPKDDEYVRDPSCEYCRGAEANDTASNCMDGEQEGETCRDDVYYFGGGPADSGAVDDGEDAEPVSAPEGSEGGITSVPESSDEPKAVPALGFGALVLAAGAVAVALARK